MKIGFLAASISTLLLVAAASAAPRGDANGDGKLSLGEYQAARLARVMQADKNGDGKISLEEWLARPAAARMKGDPSAIFKQRDANGDGFIDAAEAEALAKQRFDLVDVNHDGAITDEEWAARRKAAAATTADDADDEQSASSANKN